VADGRSLPEGYGPQWAAEMDALLGRGEPFALLFLDSAEKPAHEDQKAQMQWLKMHKKQLAALCRGAVAVEPDQAKRLLKRAQGMMVMAAFGLRFAVTADREGAEARARKLLAGEAVPDEEE
jgi:hypothetical protein